MGAAELEKRVAALELEVAGLKACLTNSTDKPKKKWWNEIAGAFAGDPAFLEAMRLGREYRESLRPKPRKSKRKKTRNVSARHGSR